MTRRERREKKYRDLLAVGERQDQEQEEAGENLHMVISHDVKRVYTRDARGYSSREYAVCRGCPLISYMIQSASFPMRGTSTFRSEGPIHANRRRKFRYFTRVIRSNVRDTLYRYNYASLDAVP